MARVKMLTLLAGPSGSSAVGSIRECGDAEAKALVDGGYAVALPDPQPPAAVAPAPAVVEPPASTAAVEPAPEEPKAIAAPKKGKGRR